MKKLINDPRAVVRELLEGVADLNPAIALLEAEDVVVRADLPPPAQRRVAVISGGGSGHEPAHAGYVGPGLLAAAVAGDVFTSPSVDAVLAAITASAGPAGALLVVKNYTGDRLNFGLAAELARQQVIPVELAFVADDVSLSQLVPADRRRGIAGTVLIHKLAGAAAERGLPLAQVADIARRAAADLGSMGVGLGACIVPTAGTPGFELGPDEIEFGLGIHGEKGVDRTTMRSADEIVDTLIATILADRNIAAGTSVALLVNGLGGTSAMELAIVARRAIAALRQRGLAVARAWSGTFLSAMEMPGVSLSLLPLDAERDSLFDDPATLWPGSGRLGPSRNTIPGPAASPPAAPEPTRLTPELHRVAHAVAAALTAAEAHLTDLDSKAGDGDLGASMHRGALAIAALGPQSYDTPSTLLAALANALRKAIAGSSGPFYAVALLRASGTLAATPEPTPAQWLAAFRAATDAVSELGGAKPGLRTMLDALYPAAEAWQQAVARNASPAAQLEAAAAAAEAGAAATAQMEPALGRASYLGKRALGIPDGGAVAVATWLRAIANSLTRT